MMILFVKEKLTNLKQKLNVYICGGLSNFHSLRELLSVSFPQIQHKFYKHVNKQNVKTTNIKKQTI